jgi:hypothetical protein
MLPTKKRKADGTIVDADKAFNDYVSTLPENQRDSKNFNVRRYWELNGRPANFDEAVNRGMFTMNDEDKMWHAGTVAYNQAADEYEFMKSPDHPTIGMEVDAYNNSPEMAEFRQNYYLDQSTTPWKYRRREGTGGGGNTVDRHQRTGVTTDGGNTVATQETVPQLDSYDKMLEYMKATQVADADAAGRARKRELMAAIGDGISAVSSLYQTTKGAPVTYTPGADMTKVMRDRYDRMVAQRKADSDKYLNYLRVQHMKEQADDLREYKRTNQEIRREELQRQKDNDKAREDYRNMGLRLRNLERQRKIANSPGGDVYFKTLQDMIAEGYSEEDAENEAMKELAAYNTQHGTNYTIVDKRDNSGKVSRTVTVKTNDQQTAGQVEQVANSNVDNAPAPKSKSSGKSGSTSKKSSTKKPKMY